MKKVFLFLAASSLMMACTDSATVDVDKQNGDTATARRNSDNMMIVYNAIESGDTSKLGDLIADDAIDHNAAMDGSDLRGKDSIIYYLGSIRNYFDNLSFEPITDATSPDGNYHFALVRMQGTAKQNPWGIPEGTKLDDTSVDVVKINSEGKITEHWGFMSQEDVMEMMSRSQNPGGAPSQPAGTNTSTR